MVLCCLGGALGWAVYLAMGMVTGSIYLRYLVAGIAIAAYAEAMARVRKYPITAYLVVSFFPLVPGSYIYYAMYYAIQGQRQLFLESGSRPWPGQLPGHRDSSGVHHRAHLCHLAQREEDEA